MTNNQIQPPSGDAGGGVSNIASWSNGNRTVTGRWSHNWAADRFTIILDQKSPITNMNDSIVVAGDSPEWGNWKLIKPTTPEPTP